jgi:hypothetical protein
LISYLCSNGGSPMNRKRPCVMEVQKSFVGDILGCSCRLAEGCRSESTACAFPTGLCYQASCSFCDSKVLDLCICLLLPTCCTDQRRVTTGSLLALASNDNNLPGRLSAVLGLHIYDDVLGLRGSTYSLCFQAVVLQKHHPSNPPW